MPIENTLSQLTQTIRFLAANDFLQGVERYAGEADEKEKAKSKITVVGGGGEDTVEVTNASEGEGAAEARDAHATEPTEAGAVRGISVPVSTEAKA